MILNLIIDDDYDVDLEGEELEQTPPDVVKELGFDPLEQQDESRNDKTSEEEDS